jgi:predicted peroxiredoxin
MWLLALQVLPPLREFYKRFIAKGINAWACRE